MVFMLPNYIWLYEAVVEKMCQKYWKMIECRRFVPAEDPYLEVNCSLLRKKTQINLLPWKAQQAEISSIRAACLILLDPVTMAIRLWTGTKASHTCISMLQSAPHTRILWPWHCSSRKTARYVGNTLHATMNQVLMLIFAPQIGL